MTLKRGSSHNPRVSVARITFCWWRHNGSAMTSQWLDNCDANTWQVISNSLDIDFIHGRSCKKGRYHMSQPQRTFSALVLYPLQPSCNLHTRSRCPYLCTKYTFPVYGTRFILPVQWPQCKWKHTHTIAGPKWMSVSLKEIRQPKVGGVGVGGVGGVGGWGWGGGGGVYWVHPVCPSVCLSVCLSVR